MYSRIIPGWLGRVIVLISFLSCNQTGQQVHTTTGSFSGPISLKAEQVQLPGDSVIPVSTPVVNTGLTTAEELVGFAETLLGIPYVYASSDPARGFDCSGFISYVFNHFHITVPRSSVDFTYVGKTIPIDAAQRGDLILFTGTDSAEAEIGHMGLVVYNRAGDLRFIHATSGKAMSVTISSLSPQYRKRFVRVARIFS